MPSGPRERRLVRRTRGEGRAQALDHRNRVGEELGPGEMDDLVVGVTQLLVAEKLLPRLPRIRVLERAISLRDHAVLVPVEINGVPEVWAGDGLLQLRRFDPVLLEDHAGARFEYGPGPMIGEADGAA